MSRAQALSGTLPRNCRAPSRPTRLNSSAPVRRRSHTCTACPPERRSASSMGLPVEAAPKRLYVSYDSVHHAMWESLERLREAGWATPDYLVAIAGGGLIPARILRSVLRSENKGCATIKVIGLELYNDEVDGRPREEGVTRTQWLEAATPLVGKRILVVDEVDDSRQTLAYALRELAGDVAAQSAALAAAGEAVPATHLAAFVIHNKDRPKVAQLPEGVPEFVAQEVEGDPWIVYPWDADNIHLHTKLSAECAAAAGEVLA